MCKCIEQMWVWDSMRDPPSFRVIIQEFHSYNDFIRNPVRSMSNIKRKRYIKLNGSSGIITYPYMCSIPARCHLSSTDSHSKFLREFYLKVYIRLTDLSATSSVRIHCSRVSWRRRRKGEYKHSIWGKSSRCFLGDTQNYEENRIFPWKICHWYPPPPSIKYSKADVLWRTKRMSQTYGTP